MAYTDVLFQPLAEALLGCLAVAVADLTDPPDAVEMRYGQEVAFDVSQNEDLCCSGLGWVRIRSAEPATVAGYERYTCYGVQWNLSLEMGIVRCAPTGDDQHIPTAAEHAAAAAALAEDFMALRRAVCCFLGAGNIAQVGLWTPAGPAGGCIGSTITLTVSVVGGETFPT